MKTIILNQETKDTFIPSIGEVFYDKSNDVVLKCENSESGLCWGCFYYEKTPKKLCLGNCQSSMRQEDVPVIYTKQETNENSI